MEEDQRKEQSRRTVGGRLAHHSTPLTWRDGRRACISRGYRGEPCHRTDVRARRRCGRDRRGGSGARSQTFHGSPSHPSSGAMPSPGASGSRMDPASLRAPSPLDQRDHLLRRAGGNGAAGFDGVAFRASEEPVERLVRALPGDVPERDVEGAMDELRRRFAFTACSSPTSNAAPKRPERAETGALHPRGPAAHAARTATRCIVLLRYPFGFQSMEWGCIAPALSVARAQTS